MRANLELFKVRREAYGPGWQGVGEWRGDGNVERGMRQRESIRGVHHHGDYPHEGCGQSPGPGMDRGLGYARHALPFLSNAGDEGFR